MQDDDAAIRCIVGFVDSNMTDSGLALAQGIGFVDTCFFDE